MMIRMMTKMTKVRMTALTLILKLVRAAAQMSQNQNLSNKKRFLLIEEDLRHPIKNLGSTKTQTARKVKTVSKL